MESSRVPCASRGKQRVGAHDIARDIITGRWIVLAIVSLV
jgi:hypothetical protein